MVERSKIGAVLAGCLLMRELGRRRLEMLLMQSGLLLKGWTRVHPAWPIEAHPVVVYDRGPVDHRAIDINITDNRCVHIRNRRVVAEYAT